MAARSADGPLDSSLGIGIIGAGTMGAGIAQVAATAGHHVYIFDLRAGAAENAVSRSIDALTRLATKRHLTPEQAKAASSSLHAVDSLSDLAHCGLIIEAIVEDLAAKQALFRELETIAGKTALFATNTSSLSITAIASHLSTPERLAGMHFFNPAPLMALVEIVSGLATSPNVLNTLRATAIRWGKTTVLARSTPGFVVNRIARPFYTEALRLLNEGATDCATIDAVMREAGGFRMGPFELMDLIGNDINYAVTRSLFDGFFGDPRFTPSLRQQELVEAGYLGRKTGRGFYTYTPELIPAQPASCSPHEAPHHVRIFVDDPLARALASRLSNSSVTVNIESAHRDGRIAEATTFILYRTDGRTATQRAADLSQKNLVLIDLARDYATATRLALSIADQAEPSALHEAIGFLQAAGFAVSRIDDVPGLILMRTVAMLANEAADAVQQGVCTVEDCDLAMRLGVNYPCGPLECADELGAAQIRTVLEHLAAAYGEDRYRVSPLLRRKAISGATFHSATCI